MRLAKACTLHRQTLPMPHSRAHAVGQIDQSEVTSVPRLHCTKLCTLHVQVMQGT